MYGGSDNRHAIACYFVSMTYKVLRTVPRTFPILCQMAVFSVIVCPTEVLEIELNYLKGVSSAGGEGHYRAGSPPIPSLVARHGLANVSLAH
jgi:hypothetical protein